MSFIYATFHESNDDLLIHKRFGVFPREKDRRHTRRVPPRNSHLITMHLVILVYNINVTIEALMKFHFFLFSIKWLSP